MIPKQSGTVTRHDLQDLRRRLLLDQRAVDYGDLSGVEVLAGAITILDGLIDKADGKGFIAASGYRYPGLDGSYPEEVDA